MRAFNFVSDKGFVLIGGVDSFGIPHGRIVAGL